MAIFQLIAVLIIAALTKAEEQPNPSLFEILRVPDESSVPISYGLPKEEAPEPFYSPAEPKISILEVPRSYFTPNINQEYPIPSEELQLPSIEPWNPNNDPKFYYELPAVITKQQQPTNFYPKKYNEDVYEKEKPLAGRPKQEINLTPITKEDFLNKQKSINKVLLNMEKIQNQKVIEAEKVQSLKNYETNSKITNEPETAATGFSQGFNSNGDFGLNSASSELHHSSPYRHHFHTQGHDGPHSYKWGFDTGKGHSRQFRFEEKDKHGHVKGHYGFYDKHGKLQMIHYNADPHHGFNIDENH